MWVGKVGRLVGSRPQGERTIQWRASPTSVSQLVGCSDRSLTDSGDWGRQAARQRSSGPWEHRERGYFIQLRVNLKRPSCRNFPVGNIPRNQEKLFFLSQEERREKTKRELCPKLFPSTERSISIFIFWEKRVGTIDEVWKIALSIGFLPMASFFFLVSSKIINEVISEDSSESNYSITNYFELTHPSVK